MKSAKFLLFTKERRTTSAQTWEVPGNGAHLIQYTKATMAIAHNMVGL